MHKPANSAPSQIRRARLSVQDCFDAWLTYYPPHLSQPAHEHGCSQFSLLLSGGLIEHVDGREFRAGPGQASAKAKGTAHADDYGPEGALLLSFNFRCEDTASALMSNSKWQWRSGARHSRHYAASLARMERGLDLDQGVWDLFALGEPARTATPPEWLRWVRRELDRSRGSADVGSLAAQAGVHRVRLTREFTRHFGLPPSAYRQHQMAGRALRALIDGKTTAADAAYRAGFADQSHMIRTMRRTFGMTPRRLASLLAN